MAIRNEKDEKGTDGAADTLEALRKEFEKKLDDVQAKLDKRLDRPASAIVDQDDDPTISDLRERLDMARARMMYTIQSGEDIVRTHPLLLVGGALAFGVLLGALIGRTAQD